MSTIKMKGDIVTDNNNRKVAQLYKAIKNRLNVNYIETILQQYGDINSEFPVDCAIDSSEKNVNLLHLAYNESNIRVFQLLLNHKADFTAKNDEGFSVVHRVIQGSRHNFEIHRDKFQNPFVDSILSAHLEFANTSNPTYRDDGLSHFHAACMTDNVEAVEFFLKHGTSIDQSVNANSTIFAGYSPLHFAARYSCLRTAEILLKHGANMHSRDANGLTPLSLLIERKINGSNDKLIKLLLEHDIVANRDYTSGDKFHLSNLHAACVLDSTSLLERILLNQVQVDQSIDKNSPICPGYTPLHFAASFNFNSVELLMNKGADIEAKDVSNVTPFDLTLRKHSVKDVLLLLSSKPKWANIILSDKKTQLTSVVSAMTSVDELELFLANNESAVDSLVPNDSPLWPGCTILHLAVIFSERRESKDMGIVEKCLTRGVDVTVKDAKGSTPLHLAFYLQKRRVVEFLLKHHVTVENPLDSNSLSHFHIACAARDENAVERFLSNRDVDVNVAVNSTIRWSVMCSLQGNSRFFFIVPGATALHINVASGNRRITKMLLDRGADLYATDVNGFTPIHRLLTSRTLYFHEQLDDLLFNVDDLRDSTANCGLTHLHVACALDKLTAVEKLMESGANIETRVRTEGIDKHDEVNSLFDPYGADQSMSFLSRYNGFTALNFAMKRGYHTIKQFLINNGADVFVENTSEHTPLPIYEILNYYSDSFMPILMKNADWQVRLRDELGLTMLHLACQAVKLDVVVEMLNSDENVNARVKVDSPIWPGCTPLHLAINGVVSSSSEDDGDLKKIVGLLLDNGADLTMMNCEGQTPLHAVDAGRNCLFIDSPYTDMLLNSLKDYSVNPTNPQGISFFHIACIKKDVAKVARYLKNGADVNQPVNHFSDKYSGCTPLHLAAGYRSQSLVDIDSQLKIVDLLLEHGADVNSKDSYDNTSLHAAAERGSSRETLFEMIIKKEADVKAQNIFGETPLEILAKSGNATWEEVNCLVRHGCHVNSYNPITKEGYVPKFFIGAKSRKDSDLANVIVKKLLSSDYITEVDKEGRTFLHNLVSVVSSDNNYTWHRDDLIERLLKRGCRINHRDKKGKTALHTAAFFKNSNGVRELLKNGADINEMDDDNKTAFSYVFDESCFDTPEHLVELFAMHVHKMQLCGLHVNETNRQLKVKAMEKNCLKGAINRFDNILEKTKNVNVGSTSFTLYDFCFNENSKFTYSSMSYTDRREIDVFFAGNENSLREMDNVLLLKYKLTTEKFRLIGPAIVSFSNLIRHQLPDLCCRVILNFLTNADLENVIASTT